MTEEWRLTIVQYDRDIEVFTSDNIHIFQFRGEFSELVKIVEESTRDVRRVELTPVKYIDKRDLRRVPRVLNDEESRKHRPEMFE
jgi:hypothetical protein